MFKHSTGVTKIKAKAELVEGVCPKRNDDGHFWDVLGVNRDLVITLQQVELAEDAHPMKVGGNVGNVGKGVVVRFYDQVEMVVITTGPPGAVTFPDEVKRRGPRAGHLLT